MVPSDFNDISSMNWRSDLIAHTITRHFFLDAEKDFPPLD